MAEALSGRFYNKGLNELQAQNIDWENDDIRVILLNDSYSVDIDSHEYYGDISDNEVSGTNYTEGDKQLANMSINRNDTDDRIELKADDVTWEDATITAYGAAVLKWTGDEATSPLICYLEFDGAEESDGADFNIEWNGGVVARVDNINNS